MAATRAIVALAILAVTTTHPASAQWLLSSEIGTWRFWGGVHAAGTAAEPRVYPITRASPALRVEREFGAWGLELATSYSAVDVGVDDGVDQVVFARQGHLVAVFTGVSRRIILLEHGGELRGHLGPSFEAWRLSGEDRLRIAIRSDIGLRLHVAGSLFAETRASLSVVPTSVFASSELRAGTSRRPLWRRGITGGLSLRL